jgi:exosortase
LKPRVQASPASLLAWASVLGGTALFHLLGNATRGYIQTDSLFVWWVQQWLDPVSELQHAWILLGLGAWIFVQNLRQNSAIQGTQSSQREGEHRGNTLTFKSFSVFARYPLFLSASLALHLLGYRMQQSRLSLLALLLFAWAALGLLGGRRLARAAFFPLSLLLFAIPFGFLDSTGFWMRLWVVDASQALASLLQLDVVQSGTRLFSSKGQFQYDVAAACSGLRSLTALLALSLVAAYLGLRSLELRSLVFLSAFPLVYLGNLLRILAILLAGSLWGQGAGSRVHDYSGLIVFAFVLGAQFLLIRLLKRQDDTEPPTASRFVRCRIRSLPKFSVSRFPNFTTCLMSHSLGTRFSKTLSLSPRALTFLPPLAVLLSGLGLFWMHSHQPEAACGVRLADNAIDPLTLPSFLGSNWGGRFAEVSPVERELLPPDTGFSRKIYLDLEKRRPAVFVSLVLSGKDRSSIHRPELCLVGQGWSILESRRQHFAPASGQGKGMDMTLLRVLRQIPGQKSPAPELVAYCFIGAEDTCSTQTQRLWSDAWSRLAGKPQRWAYLFVQTQAGDGEAPALARLQDVVGKVMPELLQHPQQ